MANKCFAYYEAWKSGVRRCTCDIMKPEEFKKIRHMNGGCCARNCRFYKPEADLIRSDWGIYPMSQKQIETRKRYDKR